MAKGEDKTFQQELVTFKVVEREVVVEVPKYVDKIVEVPKYTEVEYEKPVINEVVYEKPVVKEKDITVGLRALVIQEVQKGLAEVIQTLKVSAEIPLSRVLQVRTGGRSVDASGDNK